MDKCCTLIFNLAVNINYATGTLYCSNRESPKIAYLTNYQKSTVSMCDPKLTKCEVGHGGGTFDSPRSIAFYNNKAYVVSYSPGSTNKGRVYICNPELTNCDIADGANTFTLNTAPYSIAFYPESGFGMLNTSKY